MNSLPWLGAANPHRRPQYESTHVQLRIFSHMSITGAIARGRGVHTLNHDKEQRNEVRPHVHEPARSGCRRARGASSEVYQAIFGWFEKHER
jgi:hypothetical protein